MVVKNLHSVKVLGVGFATAKFKDGDRIRVDGDKGEVSKT